MQIDQRHHTILGKPDPFSVAHIAQAAGILKDYFEQIQQKHPTWLEERQLQRAAAAYNFGVSNVSSLEGVDKGTTHDDYSNDVWAMALFYSRLP